MHDVAIIGAGVVGSGIARELARRKLDVIVVDRGHDAGTGASKANSGIVHAGYDAYSGTLKAKYNVAGNPLFDDLASELDFPFKRIGSLVLAFGPDQVPALERLVERGRVNGVPGLEIVGRDRLLELEPHIGPGAVAAMLAPTGGIVCPYEMTIALAENAAANGVTFLLGRHVLDIARGNGFYRLIVGDLDIDARVVVNAAGLFSDAMNNMVSKEKIEIIPRRGEYFLMDRSEDGLVNHTLFQLPGAMGKGVLLTPSVDGNILAGPTSEEVADKDDVETTRKGLARIVELAARDVVALPLGKTIASFSGIRAHSSGGDFIIGPAPGAPRFINVAGIESPGLTSAPAIARDVAAMVADLTKAGPNPAFNPIRRPAPRFRHMSSDERRRAIAGNPDYGHMVCRCENVTKAEIVAALRSPLGVRDLDAIKRRTRAGMGRCQGGFCGMRLPEIIAETTGIPVTEVTKFGGGSRLLLYKDKTTL